MGTAGLSNLTRSLRTTRDVILLKIVSENAQPISEIVSNYEFVTGEIVGHDSLEARLRRLRRDRLIRLASTGRDIPGMFTGLHYTITPTGKDLLEKFKGIIS